MRAQVEHGDFKIVLEYQEFSPTLVHRSFTLINKATKTVGLPYHHVID